MPRVGRLQPLSDPYSCYSVLTMICRYLLVGVDMRDKATEQRINRLARNLTALLYPIDNRMCDICDTVMAVQHHHINGIVWDLSPDNISYLCDSCHRQLHVDIRRTQKRYCIDCGKEWQHGKGRRCWTCKRRHWLNRRNST
jgi:hypothetical protein